MGRPSADIDTEELLKLLDLGPNQKEMASQLGVSVPTLSRKIADIQSKQGLILKYRALQSLQLTELQARVLEAITPEKIDEAPLRDLVGAYRILKDKELVTDGKPTEIKGLVAYLVEMEKQELALSAPEEILDVTEEEGGGGLGSLSLSDLNLREGELH